MRKMIFAAPNENNSQKQQFGNYEYARKDIQEAPKNKQHPRGRELDPTSGVLFKKLLVRNARD